MTRVPQPTASLPAPVAEDDVAPAEAVFDPNEALQRCANSPRLLVDMVQCFDSDVEQLLPQIQAAAERRDWPEVARLGHRMKGTLIYLAAPAATAAAQRVERLDKSTDETGGPAEVVRLQRQCQMLQTALRAWSRSRESAEDG